jgi:hypothetical protein
MKPREVVGRTASKAGGEEIFWKPDRIAKTPLESAISANDPEIQQDIPLNISETPHTRSTIPPHGGGCRLQLQTTL